MAAEEAEPAKEPGERPSKRRCFWEYRRSRETSTKKKLGGDVRWSLSWSSSTLPSTLYRREGERTQEPPPPVNCDWLRAEALNCLTHCHITTNISGKFENNTNKTDPPGRTIWYQIRYIKYNNDNKSTGKKTKQTNKIVINRNHNNSGAKITFKVLISH